MDTPITRAEHEEFVRRVEQEHRRLDKRLENIEDEHKQITDLVVSVNKLAVSMEVMSNEQKAHNKKLDALEARDGEKWRQMVGYIVCAVAGLVIGSIFEQIGI